MNSIEHHKLNIKRAIFYKGVRHINILMLLILVYFYQLTKQM